MDELISERFVSFALGMVGGVGMVFLILFNFFVGMAFGVVVAVVAGLWDIRCRQLQAAAAVGE